MHDSHDLILYCLVHVRDIDQTDFHRSEPSSRIGLMDEHSFQVDLLQRMESISRHRGANDMRM